MSGARHLLGLVVKGELSVVCCCCRRLCMLWPVLWQVPGVGRVRWGGVSVELQLVHGKDRAVVRRRHTRVVQRRTDHTRQQGPGLGRREDPIQTLVRLGTHTPRGASKVRWDGSRLWGRGRRDVRVRMCVGGVGRGACRTSASSSGEEGLAGWVGMIGRPRAEKQSSITPP